MNKNQIFIKSHSVINKLIVAAVVATLFTSPFAFAAGLKSFSAPDTTVTQTEDSIVIIYNQQTKKQTIIIDPSYSGGSSFAGYMFAVPSKPTFFEAPKSTFSDLEKLISVSAPVVPTSPVAPIIPTTPAASTNADSDAILNSILGTAVTADGQPVVPTIAPQQNISGSLTQQTTQPVAPVAAITASPTTLEEIPASNTKGIGEWLVKKNLKYSLTDLQNFSYYSGKNGYFMVAIKSGSTATVQGITFSSPYPVIPIRLLADKNATVNSTLDVYTISETPLYVPATKILVSKQLADFKPTTYPTGTKTNAMDFGTAFSVKEKWLTHSEITIDPKTTTADLFMSIGTNKLKVAAGLPVQVSSAGVLTSKAVVAADISVVLWDPNALMTQADITADPSAHPYAALLGAKRTLQAGLSGNDIKSLQLFLRDFIDIAIKPDGKWGPKTSKAVETFQEAFSLKKDGRVGPQTRGMIELIPISEIIKREQEVKAQLEASTATGAAAVATPTVPAATATPTTPAAAATPAAGAEGTYSLDSLMEIIQGAGGATPAATTPEALGAGPGGSIIGGGNTTTPPAAQ